MYQGEIKRLNKNSKIYVAGHTGLVGSAITRELQKQGYNNLCLMDHGSLDLRDGTATKAFFDLQKPEYVFMAAATVGGVVANNTHPATFFYDNISMGVNVIHCSYETRVKKLLYLGSNCMYPPKANIPFMEESLLTGSFEKTNEAYAMAKTACLKMCEYYNREYGMDFISCMPAGAYGPGDDYDTENSHVIAALIRKFHEAKTTCKPEVVMWGSGKPIREFIFVEDIAKAAIFLMNNYSGNETVNIGTGDEYSIGDLAGIIRDVIGYKGKIFNDTSKPDGMMKKVMDSSKLFAMGWKPSVTFEEGIIITYKDFLERGIV